MLSTTERTRTLTRMALCTALLCIACYVAIPLPFTPVVITLQTLVINLIALLLPPRQTAGVLGLYLLLGTCGLPVFAGGSAGPGVFLGPTGGYLVGFFVSGCVVSMLKGKDVNILRWLGLTVVLGIFLVDLFGVLFLAYWGNSSIPAAVMTGAVPFLPGDIFKAVTATVVAAALQRVLARQV